MKEKKERHPESCLFCAWSWFHEHDIGEVTNTGNEGWVCDGHKRQVGNLKHFPFRNKQACFKRREAV
ncbi:MAG: hypothetical protein KAS30_01745 [Candidatus Diapherotrites archaeon]|nr:hypothetical protein [Candidatus Diapherotrites archaeon]